MSNRNNIQEIHKEVQWTFWKFLPLFITVILILGGLGFGLNSLGVFGSTVVERKVFEHSYQRSESIKAQIALETAILAEIEQKLRNPNLEENIRYNLMAQATAARIRISAAKGRQL